MSRSLYLLHRDVRTHTNNAWLIEVRHYSGLGPFLTAVKPPAKALAALGILCRNYSVVGGEECAPTYQPGCPLKRTCVEL